MLTSKMRSTWRHQVGSWVIRKKGRFAACKRAFMVSNKQEEGGTTAWHAHSHLGFNVSKLDESIFIRTKVDEAVHILVSTDDMIIMGNTRAVVDYVKRELRASFEITDQGELAWLLGLEVKWDRTVRMLALSQMRCSQNVLTLRKDMKSTSQWIRVSHCQ